MIRFKIGSKYRCCALYGGEIEIEIVEKNDDFISYKYPDDDMKRIIKKKVEIFDDIEYIECWEYKGHKGYFIASIIFN